MHRLYLKIKLFVPLFQALNKVENEWKSVAFIVMLYKDTNTYILKSTDDISQLLDDHIVLVQSMSFSPFKKPFEERMNLWESKLKMTQVLVFPLTRVVKAGSWAGLPCFNVDTVQLLLGSWKDNYQESVSL